MAAFLMAAAFCQSRSGGYGSGSAFDKLWNGSKLISINGKITGKLINPPMANTENSVAILVKQTDKPVYEVQLGPEWYVSHLATAINTGDNVTILGSKVMLGNRSVIMAEIVTKGKTDIRFRDKNGLPYWVGVTKPVEPVTAGESGTVVSQGTVEIDGIDYTTYRINTDTGDVDMLAGPVWFVNRQDYVLRIGSSVQILGAMRPVAVGNHLFVAEGLYSGGSTFVIRPFGY